MVAVEVGNEDRREPHWVYTRPHHTTLHPLARINQKILLGMVYELRGLMARSRRLSTRRPKYGNSECHTTKIQWNFEN